MKRGAQTKETSEMVTCWVPEGMKAAIDLAVKIEDSDRSKFIRNAIRERVRRYGITTTETKPT